MKMTLTIVAESSLDIRNALVMIAGQPFDANTVGQTALGAEYTYEVTVSNMLFNDTGDEKVIKP